MPSFVTDDQFDELNKQVKDLKDKVDILEGKKPKTKEGSSISRFFKGLFNVSN